MKLNIFAILCVVACIMGYAFIGIICESLVEPQSVAPSGVFIPLKFASLFITPNDEMVIKYSSQVGGGPEDVYNWINSNFRYRPDITDEWSTPHEMLSQFEENGVFHGDCEDVSFLATSMFRTIGIPSKEVRTVYGYARDESNRWHMWTEIKIDGHWIPLEFGYGRKFLDCLETQHSYVPVTSFNDEHRW